VNVRAKGRAVNSVFLVQLRKIVATDFWGSARMEGLLENMVLSRAEGLGSLCGRVSSGVFWEMGAGDCSQGLHRKCRKTVVGG